MLKLIKEKALAKLDTAYIESLILDYMHYPLTNNEAEPALRQWVLLRNRGEPNWRTGRQCECVSIRFNNRIIHGG